MKKGKKLVALILSFLMVCGNIVTPEWVYAESIPEETVEEETDAAIEAEESADLKEGDDASLGTPDNIDNELDENETVEKEAVEKDEVNLPIEKTDKSEPTDEKPLSSASYIESREGLEAVLVEGNATKNQAMAVQAINEVSSLSNGELANVGARLFAAPLKAPSLTPGVPRSGDGSNIEGISAKWITEDTIDNGDASLLYLKPNQIENEQVRMQINYALSGEWNYEPGDVTITIPAYIFKNRSGKDYGKMLIPFPEDPGTSSDFNWKLIGDNYILTNTKQMSAATKGYMQFAIDGLDPRVLVDMEETDPFYATIEVVTNKGNVIGLESNKISAQIDTEARLTAVTKEPERERVKRVPASEIPESQRIPGEDEYVVVNWYGYGTITANTIYTLEINDTIPNEYSGFIVGATSPDGKTKVLESLVDVNPTQYQSNTKTFAFKTAYPASQFEPDTDYEFHNTLKMTVTEKDPENGDDPKLVTTLEDSAVAFYRYSMPVWVNPSGHFMVHKNGNDLKLYFPSSTTNDSYLTHTKGYENRSDLQMHGQYKPDGNFGIYYSALNNLKNNKDVNISYTINSVGYLMPWTYEPDGTADSARKQSNYGINPVTMVTEEKGMKIEKMVDLTPITDYTYKEIQFPRKPIIFTAVPHNINEDGSFTAVDAGDGTFLYSTDSSKENVPDIKLEVERNGAYEEWATVSFKTDIPTITYKDGREESGISVSVPENTTSFRTTVTTAIAGIKYDVRPVFTLKNTSKVLKALQEELWSKYESPETSIWNYANMKAYDSDDQEIISLDRNGYDVLEGYSIDTSVYPSKKATQTLGDVDFDKREVTIHYTSEVEIRSLVGDIEAYNEAVANGDINAETHGIWRDLLPKGVVPKMETIKLRSGDTITDSYTVYDYNGSGRTLLVVEADLTPTLSTYKDGMHTYYRDTLKISFDAACPFDAIVDYGDSIHNVISYESSNAALGSTEKYKGEADNPYGNNNVSTSIAFKDNKEKDAMKNLNKDNDNPSFVYAGVETKLDILAAARTSLNKEVMVNRDGIWSYGTYEDNRTVYTGGHYAYKLRMMSNDETLSKDLILYDSLENFYADSYTGSGNDPADVDAPRWRGYFEGVDVSQIVNKGGAPVVYYSLVENLKISDETDPNKGNAVNINLANRSIWVPATEYTGELKDVKAVAIDATKNADGTDFVLDAMDSVVVIINMRAPDIPEAIPYIAEDAHAYNNAYLHCTSIDKTTGHSDSDNFVRKDYTKVGLEECKVTVTKSWDDDNNRDGVRPETVTIHLFADGVDTGKSLTLSGEETKSFDNLPYVTPEGDIIRYTVTEDAVSNYTSEITSRSNYEFVVKNTHEPERISLSGTKTWVEDNENVRPENITIKLLKNGKAYKNKTISAPWEYEFTDLYKYENWEEIVYTVEEYITDSLKPYIPEYDGFNIKNTYHPYGDLLLTKHVENATEVSSGKEYTFQIHLTENSSGNVKPLNGEFSYDVLNSSGDVIKTETISSGGTLKLKDGESANIKEIPHGTAYDIYEQTVAGFSTTSTGSRGTIIQNETKESEFVNKYSAEGQINVPLTKVLNNKEIKRHQFIFEMYDEEGTLVKLATNELANSVEKRNDDTVESSTATAIFGALKFTEKDHGKTFKYTVKERDRGVGGYTYDIREYEIEITVMDNGDGTMNVAMKEVPGGIKFENTYKAEGDLELKAWKVLDGRELKDDEFSFEILDPSDESANPEPVATGKNKADGTISFSKIHFDEKSIGRSFTYTVKESIGSDPTVNYADTVYDLTVNVFDNGDGTLGFSTEVKEHGGENAVPVFTNSLKPGNLSVEKHVTNPEESDPNQAFKFKVEFYGDVEGNDFEGTVTEAVRPLLKVNSSLSRAVLNKAVETARNEKNIFDIIKDFFTPDEVYAAEDIDSGTYDGIDWRITSEGELILGKAGETQTMTAKTIRSASSWPWRSYRYRVKKVSVAGDIVAQGSLLGMFDGSMAVTIDFANKLDTSNVTNMNRMFADCSALTSLKLGDKFDTSSVTSMGYMFSSCRALTSLDLGDKFDTSSVTNMGSMFAYCSALTTLDLGDNFDTSSVTDMGGLFSSCNALTSLDLGDKFDTSSVTDMRSMFYSCSALTTLDLGDKFDTSSVTDMYQMFAYCSALTTLDLGDNFDTSSVTNMGSMFAYCSALTSLDLGDNFDTSSVTNMWEMFFYCRALTSLDLGDKFDTSSVTNMYSMFFNCYALTSLNLGDKFDTSNVTTMTSMFSSDPALNKIYIPGVFSFKGNGNASTSLPIPPSSTTTGKWMREDGSIEGKTNTELANEFNASYAGTWVWEPKPLEYTVIFDSNGGSGSMTQMNATIDSDFAIPSNSFYKFGSKFVGWKDNVNNKTFEAIIPAGTYAADTVVTLSAQWEDIQGFTKVADGVYEFELQDGMKMTIGNIPAGTTYKVYEETPDSWVLVSSTGDSGVIEPLETSQAVFSNEYEPGTTSVQFVGTKYLDGNPGDGFSFELREGNTLIETVTAAKGMIKFAPIKYTSAGTHNYTIKEVSMTDSSINYDTHAENINVKITDNGDGTMSKEVTYDSDGIVFNNETKPENKVGSLEITKVLSGKTDANKNDEFSFLVTLKDEKGIPYQDKVTYSVGTRSITVTPEAGEINVTGIKEGSKVTFNSLPSGTAYSVEEVNIPKGWTLKEITNASGVISGNFKVSVTATNEYSAKGFAYIEAHKLLKGEVLNPGMFTFELLENGSVIDTKTNSEVDNNDTVFDNDGNIVSNPYKGMGVVTFDEISYTEEGTYTYTIREKFVNDGKYEYDAHTETVTVTVKDVGSGLLESTVKYDSSGPVFTNSLVPKTGNLSITKNTDGETEASQGKSFTFKVTLKDARGDELEDTFNGTTSAGNSVRVKSGNEITLKKDENLTITGLPEGTTYEISESNAPGWTPDKGVIEGTIVKDTTTEVTFVNRYDTSGNIELKGTKTLIGRELEDGEFTFILTDEEGNEIESKNNDSDGLFSLFIDYTKSDVGKTYKYYIKEKSGRGNTYYDPHTEEITVNVVDNGEGVILPVVTYDLDGIKFENITLEDVGITKKVVGYPLDRSYAITVNLKGLIPGETYDVGRELITASEFGEITFTASLKDGETIVMRRLPVNATYTVEEASGNYDAAFSITDNKNLGKIAKASGTNKTDAETVDGGEEVKVSFTNTLWTGDLEISKILTGLNTSLDRPFNFTITAEIDEKGLEGSFDYTGTKSGKIAFADGKASISLKHNDKITIKDLPYGATWKVEETEDAEYVAEKIEITGTISKETSKADFVNKSKWEKVYVEKLNIEGKFVIGAHLGVYKDETDELVSDWTTENKVHEMYLLPGRYYLSEIEAPKNGMYLKAPRITFAVNSDGTISYDNSVKNKVTMTDEYVKTSVNVEKVWNDDFNRDGIRPKSITVNLLADGKKVDEAKGYSANNYAVVFTNLDKYKNEKLINYTVEETSVTGYEASVKKVTEGAFKITNTHKPEKVDVKGKKIWDDNNNQDGKRPGSVKVILLANGKKLDEKTVTEKDNWEYKFTNLKMYENGTKITYTVQEEDVKEYSKSINGFDITNSYTPGKTSVTFSKVWNDDNNRDGIRPESITIHLLANGVDTGKTVKATSDTNYSGRFTDLDEYKGGKIITYTVTEDEIPGYTSEITGEKKTGFVITNSHTPETKSINGNKIWDDDNNRDGKRPDSVTIILLGNGKEVERKEVTSLDDWKYEFTDLPVKENGKDITYTVDEEAVSEYEKAIDGLNITNSRESEKISIPVSKVWNDGNDRDRIRPDSIEVTLLKNGEELETLTLTKEDNYAGEFKDLLKYENGKEINYTISEKPIDGYVAKVQGSKDTGLTVINVHETKTTVVSGKKIWNDQNDFDGFRPESITVRLYANGEEIDSKEVSIKTGWAYEFSNLYALENGKIIEYTVKEDPVPGYKTSYDGFNIINTHEPELISIEGEKVWDDNDNQDGVRPSSVTVNLLANGEKVKEITVSGSWKYAFNNLPKYKNGHEIVYTVTENVVPKYTTSIDGFTITNTYSPEKTSVFVSKFWDDVDNMDGIRPDKVTVSLYANDKVIDKKDITTENPTVIFNNLPAYEGGKKIEYSVKEENVPEGYDSAVTGDMEHGFTITNSHTPLTVSISGTKTWVDQDDKDRIRPDSIRVILLADGKEIDYLDVKGPDWKYAFNNLPKNNSGKEIVYSVKEVDVFDYTSSIDGFDITNTHEVYPDPVKPEKYYTDKVMTEDTPVYPGKDIGYTLTWANNTRETKNVILKDTLSKGLTFKESKVEPIDIVKNADGTTTVYWYLGEQERFSKGEVKYIATVNEDAIQDGYLVTNDYQLYVGEEHDYILVSKWEPINELENPVPGYEMTKERITPATLKQGTNKYGFYKLDEVTYEVEVENVGRVPLDITVTDSFEIPKYFDNLRITEVKGEELERINDVTSRVHIEPKESVTILYKAVITKDALERLADTESDDKDNPGDGYINTAKAYDVTAKYKDADGEEIMLTEENVGILEAKDATANTPVKEFSPSYTVTKKRIEDAPKKAGTNKYGFSGGDKVTYDIEVKNDGDLDLELTISDEFPDKEYFNGLKIIKIDGEEINRIDDVSTRIALKTGETAVITYECEVSKEAKEYLAAKKEDDSINPEDGYINVAKVTDVTAIYEYPNGEKDIFDKDDFETLEDAKASANTPVQVVVDNVTKTKAPSTGDSNDVIPMMMLFAITGTLLIITYKKRKW